MVIFSPQLLLCTSQIFRHGINITLSLDMVYLELLNNAFKALNLILNKYVAEIQLPGNAIRLLSIPQSSSQSSDTG